MAARRPEDRTDVDLILEEISKRLKRIEQTTDKTLRTSARQGKIDTAPVGIRAALKQKMIRGIFGNYLGSAMIRKGEKKRTDRELTLQREDELQHQRDLEGIKQTTKSDTMSKDITSKIDDLMTASQKMSESMSKMNENLLKVSTIVVAIQKRVSPRDVNVGEDKKIRYDPLAPAGFQYSEVTASGKSGKIAKSSDANKAAFSASRQMAKEAVEDTKATQTAIPDEYSQEKADIAKSEKIDIPTEDVNAKRYEKIQETLDEIMKKLDDGGFFGGLMKAIAAVGTTIATILKNSIGSVMKVIMKVAKVLGGRLAAMATRLLPIIARFAGPAAAVAAAGYAGYKAGEWLNENTNIQENIASGIESIKGLFGASDEDKAKEADQQNAQKLYQKRVDAGEKISQSMANFYKSQGVSVDESVVVSDEDYKKMRKEEPAEPPKVEPKVDVQPTPKIPSAQPPQTGAEIDKESREMYDGKEDRKTNEIKTLVLPPPAQPPRKSNDVNVPITIKVRNTDPTLATYRASIFDHPVTHPGNFMM